MASRTVPAAPKKTLMPEALKAEEAFGPKFPVITASAPFWATNWADWIPAPPDAITFSFWMASNWRESESTKTKYWHRPNRGSTGESKSVPDAVTTIFILSSLSHTIPFRLFSKHKILFLFFHYRKTRVE